MKILKLKRVKTLGMMLAAVAILALMPPMTASAHCDTMDGPTVADGLKAMESNNINYALKWIQPEYEGEINELFNLSMKVKDLSPEAKELAEQYFLSELIRLHRAGEGAGYTGLKPSGSYVDEVVLAADQSIEVGNLSPLEGLIEEEMLPELTERFEKVMKLKDFDVNDVEAGREYIEAYVSFFKFAEGEEDHHGGEVDAHSEHGSEATVNSHNETEGSSDAHTKETAVDNTKVLPKTGEETFGIWIPWILAGMFFATTVIVGVKLKHGNCSKR